MLLCLCVGEEGEEITLQPVILIKLIFKKVFGSFLFLTKYG